MWLLLLLLLLLWCRQSREEATRGLQQPHTNAFVHEKSAGMLARRCMAAGEEDCPCKWPQQQQWAATCGASVQGPRYRQQRCLHTLKTLTAAARVGSRLRSP